MTFSVAPRAAPGEARPILMGRLEIPSDGAWWFDGILSKGDNLVGPVTLSLDGVDWTGTVMQARADGAQLSVRIVGGAGGLGTLVQDRYQQSPSTTLRSVASEVAALGGETLADSAVDVKLGSWQRLRGTVGTALDDLVRVLGLRWRVNRLGQVAIYNPALVTDTVAGPGTLTDQGETWVEYKITDGLTFEAPIFVDGFRAEHVVLEITPKDTKIRLQNKTLRTTFRTLVPDRSHGRIYQARVTAQHGANVDVTVDAPSAAGNGPGGIGPTAGQWALRNIPLWVGCPGASVTLNKNARVLVMFPDDDPRKTLAMLSPYDDTPIDVTIDAPTVNIGKGASHSLARGDVVKDFITFILTNAVNSGLTPIASTAATDPTLAKYYATEGGPLAVNSSGPGRTP